MKPETGKKQDVMTLSDSDDVQTISSGSDDNKERGKATPGEEERNVQLLNQQCTDCSLTISCHCVVSQV